MRQGSMQIHTQSLVIAWLLAILVGVSPVRSLDPWPLVLLALGLSCCLGFGLLSGQWQRVQPLFFSLFCFGGAWVYQGWHWQQAQADTITSVSIGQSRFCLTDWPRLSEHFGRVMVVNEQGQHLWLQLAAQQGQDWVPGDCLYGQFRLRPLSRLQSPGLVNRQWAQLSQGLIGQANLVSLDQHRPAHSSLQRIRNHIWQRLAPYDNTGLLRAISLGSRSALSPWLQQVLIDTGLYHLAVVSGLHIAIMTALGFGLARVLLLGLRGQVVLALLLASGYALLAGGNLPVLRAWLMAALALCLLLGRHRWPSLRILLLAMMAMTLLNPLVVLAPGFWLSAMAVFWIYTALAHGRLSWWRMQWHLSLGMLPWLLFFAMPVNAASPALNIVAGPLMGLWLPLFFLALVLEPWWPAMLMQLSHGLEWLLMRLDWVNFSRYWPRIGLGQLLVGQLCLAIWLWPGRLPGTWLLPCLWLIVIYQPPKPLALGEFELGIIDVGQGQGLSLRTGNHLLVYDTGPGGPTGPRLGAQSLAQWLAAQRYGRPLHVMISHNDLDHIGGWPLLQKRFAIDGLYYGQPHPSFSAIDQARLCHGMPSWQWDGVWFVLLSAPWRDSSADDQSCILWVHSAFGSVLIMGDAGRMAEYQLLHQYPMLGPVDVLVAGHHGSNTSTSSALLARLQPELVVFQAGFINAFGHPSAQVLARLAEQDLAYFSTAEQGSLSLHFSAQGINDNWLSRWQNPDQLRSQSGRGFAVDAKGKLD